MERPSTEPFKISAVTTTEIDVGCLMWPDDEKDFINNWIVVRQVDKSEDDKVTGVFYHIRRRKEDDPRGESIISSL